MEERGEGGDGRFSAGEDEVRTLGALRRFRLPSPSTKRIKKADPPKFRGRLFATAWWTRSQSIRTGGEVPFEVAIVAPPEVPTYIGIAEKALHLKELNMNPNQIAVALKVDRTTVLRALRWVKSIPVYATGSFWED